MAASLVVYTSLSWHLTKNIHLTQLNARKKVNTQKNRLEKASVLQAVEATDFTAEQYSKINCINLHYCISHGPLSGLILCKQIKGSLYRSAILKTTIKFVFPAVEIASYASISK